MSLITIAKYSLLISVVLVYVIYTIKVSKVLNKSVVFSKSVKAFHLIAIWLFPFIWALILMELIKSSPGSHEVDKKVNEGPFFDAYKNYE